jgi:hypothetical protein
MFSLSRRNISAFSANYSPRKPRRYSAWRHTFLQDFLLISLRAVFAVAYFAGCAARGNSRSTLFITVPIPVGARYSEVKLRCVTRCRAKLLD